MRMETGTSQDPSTKKQIAQSNSSMEIIDYSFNVNDIQDTYFWNDRVSKEATEIYSKKSTRNNRSFQEVFDTTEYGHYAEMALIELFGHHDRFVQYQDLFLKDGVTPKEVKVCKPTEKDILHKLEECKKIKIFERWRNMPDILDIFTCKSEGKYPVTIRADDEYTFQGTWKWNQDKKDWDMYVQSPQSMI